MSTSRAIQSVISSATSRNSANPPDGLLLTVVIILSILAAVLVAYIIYTRLRTKRRKTDSEHAGLHQGTVPQRDHPTAETAPLRPGPRFKHTPGEDMRIAVRRPDGAWQFSDPGTPFAPSGVKDLDNVPTLKASSASIISASEARISSQKLDEVGMESQRRRRESYLDYDLPAALPPPPAYHTDAEKSDNLNSPST